MRSFITRAIASICGIFILLIFTMSVFGTWRDSDAFVYRASAPHDRSVTDVQLFDTGTGIITRLLRTTDVRAIQAAPDGRRLLIEQRQGQETVLRVINLRSGEQYDVQQGILDMARWSPDGKWIAYRQRRGAQLGVYIVAAGGGTPRFITEPVGLYHWTGDSERLVYLRLSEGVSRVDVWEIALLTGENVMLLSHERLIDDLIGWDAMLIVLQNGRPARYDRATGQMQRITDASIVGMHPIISPQKDRLALVVFDEQQNNPLVILNREGEVLARYWLPDMAFSSYVGWAILR